MTLIDAMQTNLNTLIIFIFLLIFRRVSWRCTDISGPIAHWARIPSFPFAQIAVYPSICGVKPTAVVAIYFLFSITSWTCHVGLSVSWISPSRVAYHNNLPDIPGFAVPCLLLHFWTQWSCVSVDRISPSRHQLDLFGNQQTYCSPFVVGHILSMERK